MLNRKVAILAGFLWIVLMMAACYPPAQPSGAGVVPTTTTPMSEDEARQIASNGACLATGQLGEPAVYNDITGTWWITLVVDKPGCNPACVVDVKAKTAEVNWRCTGALPAPTEQSQLANPASVNCEQQGGQLTIESRPDGAQFGVCYFEDNRQCEEWALFRGECPVGGVKVTGYLTEAARFCAINGGEYTITANSGAPDEQGTCAFKNGQTCDAAAYYAGTCPAQ